MARADIDMKKLGVAAAALAVFVIVAVGVVLALLRHWRIPFGGAPAGSAQVLAVPPPVLQSAPQDDLARYRAEQQRWLDGTGWIDRGAGIARIPIADALELVAAGQGVHGRDGAVASPAAGANGGRAP